MELEDITSTVTLLGFRPGTPPSILIGKRLFRDGKPGRLFQQMVPVPDADLFTRLFAQARTGDTITVTVTTEWRADGYSTYLSDFVPPDLTASAEAEQARASK
jgi:hypothetical protein